MKLQDAHSPWQLSPLYPIHFTPPKPYPTFRLYLAHTYCSLPQSSVSTSITKEKKSMCPDDKNANNMKYPGSIHFPQSTSLIEIFTSENDLDLPNTATF